MAIFDGADGTRLAYHQADEDGPLICVPGGPMQASAYLGDLGGLSAHRSLVLLDLRGRPGDHRPGSSAGRRTAPGRGLVPGRLRRTPADLGGRRHGR
ncbi:MAG: alpha/beta fold hydrolase [Actinomycetes bacterium]